MSILVKIQSKGQVTLPVSLRSQAGISEGDLVEAVFHRGKIVLTPKVVIDSLTFPTSDDEYTPSQRRIIDARLAQSPIFLLLQTKNRQVSGLYQKAVHY